MSDLTETLFGSGKSFFEIEQCDKVSDKDRQKIVDMAGEGDTRTLTQISPRPKCVVTNDDILLVLRGVNLNPGSDPEDMVAVRLWLDESRIIVSQRRPVMSVDAVQERMDSLTSPVHAMIEIADEMIARIERYTFELDEQVDLSEDRALDDPSKKQRLEIMDFRRSVIGLRRYLLPQRETMMTLSRSTSKLISEEDRQTITDLYYRSARITDQLDAIRERLSLIQEEITAIISDAINQNMYVLSIISLVFLPLGFLTGLFGVNVGGMPMVAGEGGMLEGIGFWLVVAGCVIAAAFILIIMRIKKWI